MKELKILVTGANGQIGTALTQALRKEYGNESVIASDIKKPDFNNYPLLRSIIWRQFCLLAVRTTPKRPGM